MPDFDASHLTAPFVKRLVTAQFPRWADLPITPAAPQGWDNRTFRLGERLSVRLPSAAGYVPQVEKEHRWLPFLARHLPLPIPTPIALGRPGEGYPFAWSVYGWLDGSPVGVARPADLASFARELAAFLTALQRVEATSGPPAGAHSFFRGAPLATYDAETRRACVALDGDIDAARALGVWEAGLNAAWTGRDVWFHGDVAVNNLLAREGRLVGVLDFGCSGVGDPACDLAIAWTLFEGESRAVFRQALGLDDDTWVRGRAWALWKALITLEASRSGAGDEETRRVLAELLA
ncbi:aminoglycoside phosphotransferase family protein [Deinococcus yavapaiensis]|uniref:Aminoglycoside phosphotransferase (APT) family kinase protein n=1 Tax=Deinococcus yavapaiensis KR-236 TaxID=694435 RepID=A0A318SK29_9DEIO|nr:aminoglycoside phosphotransferase family protein [Deinococcus yavapaiensis]PYE54636.1 aminoglycoside phosphotransferase (APT) family kinase protein [Deinococcus yavapaiensis KR-236]